MIPVYYTRNLYLRGIAVIYLCAFLSFYIQIPGLYGNNGILPARNHLQDYGSLANKIHHKPTLLWLAPYLGLNTEYMMDVLSLLGIIIAFSAAVTQKLCTAPIFAALWSLYYSLYQVGQTFMWFQWDILLLEAGFITILVAPLLYPFSSLRGSFSPGDCVTFFLPRWLLFRLMFASGVVKLQSGCPTWWSLTALNVHFESQPLPGPVAPLMHFLPSYILRAGTVHAQVVEQILPFLFFVPVRAVRVTAFWHQVFLQVAIIISGNYNFFNLLTIVLCLSLLDDGFFFDIKINARRQPTMPTSVIIAGLHAIILGLTFVLYGFDPQTEQMWSIQFSKEQFDEFVTIAVHVGMIAGFLTLVKCFVNEIRLIFSMNRNIVVKVLTSFFNLQYFVAALFIFSVTMAPYTSLDPVLSKAPGLEPIRRIHTRMEHLQIANSYGLFRRMTGVGGRPEVIIEGAENVQGPWTELHFRYKPGDLDSGVTFVAPYQPRLDWQMWFAALGTYHQNPWLMSLTWHILNNNQDVLALLDPKRNTFDKPPKYLKASFYHYHYAPRGKIWTREKIGEYFPIFSRDSTPLVEYLQSSNLIVKPGVTQKELAEIPDGVRYILDFLRRMTSYSEPPELIWTFLFVVFIMSGFAAGLIECVGRKFGIF